MQEVSIYKMIKFFAKYPEIMAVMSEKKDGSMKLFKESVLNLENQKNREEYFKKLGIEKGDVVYAHLQNGVKVELIENNEVKIIPETDGLIAKKENLYLAITVADCIPVFFYDPGAKIIGLAHAGWRGIIGGIVKNTFEKIIQAGGRAEDIVVALGPGINVCHYSVNPKFLKEFDGYAEFLIKREGQQFADLKGMIKKQLSALGIKPENIEDNNECTFDNADKYFSYRRDKRNQENMEVMLALVGMKKDVSN